MDSAVAMTTEESEELADTLPVAAEEMACSALCSESKVDPKLASADCLDWSVLTSLSNSCMGREAMDTARCRTCWKELEKVLWPLNVMGFVTELEELAVLLVVPISNYLCKIGAEP